MTFQESVNQYKAQVKEAQAKLSEAFKTEIVEFIKGFHEIEAVRWEQYTPYFNDGEPCEFSVHEPRIKPSEETLNQAKEGSDRVCEDGGDYGDGFLSQWDLDYTYDDNRKKQFSNPAQTKLSEIINEVTAFISNVPDDIMLAAYGDHQRVTATKESVVVDPYDHE